MDRTSTGTAVSHDFTTAMLPFVTQSQNILQIEGTARQIETVKKRVGALLDRVSSESEERGGSGFGGFGGGF